MKSLLMLACASAALCAPGFAHAETKCADLAAARLPHAQVTGATLESAGALCKVAITSRPTPDSEIGIEVWLPRAAAWNGKFVQMGNGGYAGTIPSARLAGAALTGYVAAGTDDGHQNKVNTAADWALGHPEKLVDFGWRALKETTEAAKAVIAAWNGGPPKRSYFQGCSDGGREALMEAQRFPADFDGIVAGAPANYMSDLLGTGAAFEQALHRPGGYLGIEQLHTLENAALADCGGVSYVRDPANCHFDPRRLACPPGQSAGCLTPAQLDTALVIYEGRRDPRSGAVAFPGYTFGAEAQAASWQQWLTGPDQAHNDQAAIYQFASNAFRYFAFQDAGFDILTLDQGAGFDRARAAMGPIIDSDSPDLSAFKAHGGKLIQFHGWNDPAIPARSSIRYFDAVTRTMGDTGDFYRLYMIPGMLHCGGGQGASSVDWLAQIDGWVETGAAPGAIVAAPALPLAPGQRLCPWPGVSRGAGKDERCVATKN